MLEVILFRGKKGCTICETPYMAGETFETHEKKSSHKKKKKNLYCNICNIQYTSSIEFIRHTVSQKHQTCSEAQNNSQMPNLFCTLCRVRCLSPKSFSQHLLSKGHVSKTTINNVNQKPAILTELFKLITTVLDNELFPYEEGLQFIRKVNTDLVVLIDQCNINNNLNNGPSQCSTDPATNVENSNHLNNGKPNSNLNDDEAHKEKIETIDSTEDVIVERTQFYSKDIANGEHFSNLNNIKTIDSENNETSKHVDSNLNNEATKKENGTIDKNDTLSSCIKKELSERNLREMTLRNHFTLDNIPDIPKLIEVIKMELCYLKSTNTEIKRISILSGLEKFVNMIHTNAIPDSETLTFLRECNSNLEERIKNLQTGDC